MVYLETTLEEAFAKPFAAPILDMSEFVNESIDFNIMVSLQEADEVDKNGEKKGFGKVAAGKLKEAAEAAERFFNNVKTNIRNFFTKVIAKIKLQVSTKSAESTIALLDRNKANKIQNGYSTEIVNFEYMAKFIDALCALTVEIGDALNELSTKTVDNLEAGALGDIKAKYDEKISAKAAAVTAIAPNADPLKSGNIKFDKDAFKSSTKVEFPAGMTVEDASKTVKGYLDTLVKLSSQTVTAEKNFNNMCKNGADVAKSVKNSAEKGSEAFESKMSICKDITAYVRQLGVYGTNAITLTINALVGTMKAANGVAGGILKSARAQKATDTKDKIVNGVKDKVNSVKNGKDAAPEGNNAAQS